VIHDRMRFEPVVLRQFVPPFGRPRSRQFVAFQRVFAFDVVQEHVREWIGIGIHDFHEPYHTPERTFQNHRRMFGLVPLDELPRRAVRQFDEYAEYYRCVERIVDRQAVPDLKADLVADITGKCDDFRQHFLVGASGLYFRLTYSSSVSVAGDSRS